MSRKLKAVIYGDPGVGKSYFANQFPKRFFICTDGNYEWLPNAKDEDHIQIDSWSAFKDINMRKDFSKYDCIVIDLLEDLYDWCKYETCKSAGVKHISELGDYGKGYDIVYQNFLAEISKLLAKDKSIILLCHGRDTSYKDKFGVEHTYHTVTSFLPEKVIVPIEGRVRCFLRAYTETEIDPTTRRTKTIHRLSFLPDANEFGINRGEFDENTPANIPLDMPLFLELMGFNKEPAKIDESKVKAAVKEMQKVEQPKIEVKPEPAKPTIADLPKDEKHDKAADEVNALNDLFKSAPVKKEEAKKEPKPEPVKQEQPKQTEQPQQLDIASILAMIQGNK